VHVRTCFRCISVPDASSSIAALAVLLYSFGDYEMYFCPVPLTWRIVNSHRPTDKFPLLTKILPIQQGIMYPSHRGCSPSKLF